MITIKNYYYGNPMIAKDFLFWENCSMYNVLEKELVYTFFIRDKDCVKLCEINLCREPNPIGMYGIWGIVDFGSGTRITKTKHMHKHEVSNWQSVNARINFIIDEALRIQNSVI
jgi:hypothetical protein